MGTLRPLFPGNANPHIFSPRRGTTPDLLQYLPIHHHHFTFTDFVALFAANWYLCRNPCRR